MNDYLQKQVDHGISGLDIMHGHLKTLMLEAEETADSTYGEGYMDALAYLYKLTYDLSFAISERESNAKL